MCSLSPSTLREFSRCAARQAYRPIIMASQAMVADRGAQAGQRANRRGREDDDDDDADGDAGMNGSNGG